MFDSAAVVWKLTMASDDQFDVCFGLGVVKFIFDMSGLRVAHAFVHVFMVGQLA